MHCPSCGKQTRVLESRRADAGAAVRRRRQCRGCGRRLTTFERAEPESLFVTKRDGGRQPFDRGKLRDSLLRAAHKRPVSPADVEALVEAIATEARGAGGELSSRRVGELCLDGLRRLDAGAYLQFAGVDLAEPEAIRAELERLQARAGRSGAEKPVNRGDADGEFRPAGVGSSGVTPKNQREEI